MKMISNRRIYRYFPPVRVQSKHFTSIAICIAFIISSVFFLSRAIHSISFTLDQSIYKDHAEKDTRKATLVSQLKSGLKSASKITSMVIDPNGYVSYLPHSGFCNQRQELENALLLAHILNRTLILPPLYLGHTSGFSWRKFDQLKALLRSYESVNYNRLFKYSDMDHDLLIAVSNFNQISVVPMSSLFDLSPISDLVRVIHIADFVNLDVLKNKNDILEIRDFDRYAYKIVDELPESDMLVDNNSNDVSLETLYGDGVNADYLRNQKKEFKIMLSNDREFSLVLREYSHVLNLNVDWTQVFDSQTSRKYNEPPKLIQFGSLFGSTRIALLTKKYSGAQGRIRESFEFSNPFLSELTEPIIEKMGGPGHYLAIHLRLSDANFLRRAERTVRNAVNAIEKWIEEHEDPVIYLATDANIWQNDSLYYSLQKFSPFVYTLTNFTNDVTSLDRFEGYRMEMLLRHNESGWESEMSQLLQYEDQILFNDYDEFMISRMLELEGRYAWIAGHVRQLRKQHRSWKKSEFGKMWIPFLEQYICSRASTFVGTNGSTFSNFIELLFRIHWKLGLGRSSGNPPRIKYI